MAVSYHCGFEMGALGEADSSSGTVSVQSTTFRSGGYALRINPSAGPSSWVRFRSRAAAGTFRDSFRSCRFYLRVATLPGTTGSGAALVRTATSAAVFTSGAWLGLNSSGQLVVSGDNLSSSATSTLTLSADGLWHRIDFDVGWNSGAGARVYVDGIEWASISTGTPTSFGLGQLGHIPGTTWTADLYFDDVVWYDSALPATLTDYNVGLLLPTSDNTDGQWVEADGAGNTDLYTGVDNVPPVGSTATTVGTRIENSSSDTANGTYFAQFPAYNTLVSAGGTVLAVQAICNDAQAVTTGSPKAGAIRLWSAPPSAAAGFDFDYGLPNGTAGSTSAAAMGTFPAGWGTHVSDAVETVGPKAVALTDANVSYVTKLTATTREVDVDFLAVYVMWSVPKKSLVFAPRSIPRILQRR